MVSGSVSVSRASDAAIARVTVNSAECHEDSICPIYPRRPETLCWCDLSQFLVIKICMIDLNIPVRHLLDLKWV